MNEIDKMMAEIDEKIAEANRQKEEMAKKQKAVNASLKELAAAKRHVEKAQAARDSHDNINTENVASKKGTVNVVSEPTDRFVGKHEARPVETVVVETEKDKKDNASIGFIKGFATCGLVAALAFGGWTLVKESKTGEVRAAANGTRDDATVEDVNEVAAPEHDMTYDYENNEVVIYNTPYQYNFDGTNNEEVNAMGQQVINGNAANIPANGEYVELTTARFEELTAKVVKEVESIGLQVSREDVIKYVMIRNIDKLRQDNNELIEQIVGDQDIFEVITDACHVLDAMRDYNLLYFDAYHNTDGFISATLGIFDEVQLARATELERRIYEVATQSDSVNGYNEYTYALLRDALNPLNPISQLEDGVSYGMQSVDMYMVRTRFGQDKNNTELNDINTDLIKYFVSFPEDSDEYTDNALMNGNVSNIIRLLSECNVKTRTK